jgi:hypothetical protein
MAVSKQVNQVLVSLQILVVPQRRCSFEWNTTQVAQASIFWNGLLVCEASPLRPVDSS